MKYVQAIRDTRGVVVGERHGGARGGQINHVGKPWKKYHREQGVGGNRKGEPRSRNLGKVDQQSG